MSSHLLHFRTVCWETPNSVSSERRGCTIPTMKSIRLSALAQNVTKMGYLRSNSIRRLSSSDSSILSRWMNNAFHPLAQFHAWDRAKVPYVCRSQTDSACQKRRSIAASQSHIFPNSRIHYLLMLVPGMYLATDFQLRCSWSAYSSHRLTALHSKLCCAASGYRREMLSIVGPCPVAFPDCVFGWEGSSSEDRGICLGS